MKKQGNKIKDAKNTQQLIGHTKTTKSIVRTMIVDLKRRTKKQRLCFTKKKQQNLNYSSIFKDQRSVRSEQSELPVFY